MLMAAMLVAVLLVIATVIRSAVPGFRRLLIPASVLAGLLGLGVLTLAGRFGVDAASFDYGFTIRIGNAASALRSWPGTLIAVVFACLLLKGGGEAAAGAGAIRRGRDVLRTGLVVWIIVVGQIAIGLSIAAFAFGDMPGVPPSAGQLVEATFSGGHGTGAAMGALWTESDPPWAVGLDLAMVMATIGLLGSIALGLLYANIGARLGWTRQPVASLTAATGARPTTRRPLGHATVDEDVVDPLAFTLALVGLAFAIGWLMRFGFTIGIAYLPHEPTAQALDNVPLFLFTLLGGWAVRATVGRLGLARIVSDEGVRRIEGTAMELLIVAALASLRIEVLHVYGRPVAILCLAGFAWASICLLVLSPRLLPRACWFELGLINFGMSTGTTAQGMMLVRTVDPDLESGAAETYALAAPMSAPFVGGGLITFLLPAIALTSGPGLPAAAAAVAVAVLIAAAWWLRDRSGADGPGKPDNEAGP